MRALSILAVALAGVAHADELAVLRAPESVQFIQENAKIPYTEVADVISQSLGLPTLSNSDNAHARVNSLRAPRAAALFVADGLDMQPEDFASAKAWRSMEAGDMDSVATLVTAVSGKLPSEHNVPARMWLTSLGFEHAFSFPGTHSAVGNVADMLSQLFDQSVTVSVSADKQFAQATAPHPSVAKDANTYVYFMEDGAYKSKYQPMDGVKLSEEAIMKAMPEFVSAVFPGAKFCPVMKTVTVNGAVFDLKNKADFKFFSEMFAAYQVAMAQKNAASARIQAHPDFFSFGMSALPSLKLQYGSGSKQMQAAQALYKQFFSKMGEELSAAYNGEAVVTVLGLDERHDTRTLARRQAAASDPYAYVAKQSGWACTGGSEDPEYCAYGPNHAIYFQIFFWLSLLLIIATWMTIYAVANMDIKDSIIFRMTSMPRFKTE